LALVTSVQRIKTIGGLAPSSGCSGQDLGNQARVHCMAEYRFFVRHSQGGQPANRHG